MSRRVLGRLIWKMQMILRLQAQVREHKLQLLATAHLVARPPPIPAAEEMSGLLARAQRLAAAQVLVVLVLVH